MKNNDSLLWEQCTEELEQGMNGHKDFEDIEISFDGKWLLKQIKVTTQGIKEDKHSNSYHSVYKLIRIF